MSLIILFASILIEGETKNLSYKPALFKTHRECKSYLSKENDLVFGPSEDGGYWLIGLSKEIASRNIIYPFINIKWSGRDVLQKTLDNLSSQNLKIDFLSCKVDIDTIKDLETRTKSFHNYSYS